MCRLAEKVYFHFVPPPRVYFILYTFTRTRVACRSGEDVCPVGEGWLAVARDFLAKRKAIGMYKSKSYVFPDTRRHPRRSTRRTTLSTYIRTHTNTHAQNNIVYIFSLRIVILLYIYIYTFTRGRRRCVRTWGGLRVKSLLSRGKSFVIENLVNETEVFSRHRELAAPNRRSTAKTRYITPNTARRLVDPVRDIVVPPLCLRYIPRFSETQ